MHQCRREILELQRDDEHVGRELTQIARWIEHFLFPLVAAGDVGPHEHARLGADRLQTARGAAVTLASTATRTSGQGSTPADGIERAGHLGANRSGGRGHPPAHLAMNALVLARFEDEIEQRFQTNTSVTGRFAPLTNDAASLARNATTLPTSRDRRAGEAAS